MTLTLRSKFLNQTYGVRTPTFTIGAETKTTTLVRAGGGAYPSLPDECRYDVTYDRFIFSSHVESTTYDLDRQKSNYIVKLYSWLLS